MSRRTVGTPEEADAASSMVISARRTESHDAPDILRFVTKGTEQLFGRVNVLDLMYVLQRFRIK